MGIVQIYYLIMNREGTARLPNSCIKWQLCQLFSTIPKSYAILDGDILFCFLINAVQQLIYSHGMETIWPSICRMAYYLNA